MNNLYAADPGIGRDALALKYLFSLFGHSCGRYLIDFPSNWRAGVLASAKDLGDIEKARLSVLMRRAKEQGIFRVEQNMKWCDGISWLDNINREIIRQPQLLSGLILSIAEHAVKEGLLPTWRIDELSLSPTAEERILGTSAEYCRVSQPLLMSSTDITFVDPYIDFSKQAVMKALEPMMQIVNKNSVKNIYFHTRSVSSIEMEYRVKKTQLELERIFHIGKFKSDQRFEIYWWNDDQSNQRMHGRYLLSNKGGIRFDQGFQILPVGRMVDVAPISPQLHSELNDLFLNKKHDMKLAASLSINS